MLKNKLKSFRHKHEMNQVEFSAFLGVGQSQYNRWERQVWQPTLEMALILAQKLNCRVEDVFYITPNEE